MEAGRAGRKSQDLEDSCAATAGNRLRVLLTERPEYRQRWWAHARRRRGDGISYSGVAHAIALHLWDMGLRADTDRELPRKLRDRVRQALLGHQLTHETVTWFLESFEFSEEDAREIWDIFSGRSSVDLEGGGIAFTLRNPPVAMIRPQGHRTTALFSRYYVSADRSLRRIETNHVIVAIQDDLENFAYSPRDTVTSVESVIGGTFSGFHPSNPGYLGIELKLDRRLAKNEYSSLQYTTLHRATPDPCVHVRRAARKRIDNVDMRVIFEATAPCRTWWCVWDDYSGPEPIRKIPASVTPGGEIHQFVPYVEQAVVGFQWEW
ncbi:hypothetical protein ACFCZ4_35135 [Streptomyces microflavus]|uniref:hypothetical protein n=1 Tax=Streptomyces microflavus TaxID=1919 RepID=UPI0035E08D58